MANTSEGSLMKKHTINIARDFSRYPGGRYITDGDHSGERFREEFLYPYINKGFLVVIEMDGTLGYGSSFLEEAFGGYVREHGLASNQLIKQINIVSDDPSLKLEVEEYIVDAEQ